MEISPTVTTGTQAGLALNIDSTSNPQNFIIIYLTTASLSSTTDTIKVDEVVAGVYTNKASTAVTFSAGATLRAIKYGNSLDVYYNNAKVGSTLTMTANTNTLHGLFSTSSTNTFDDFAVWPRSGYAVPDSDMTVTRDTGVMHGGSSGSAKLVAGTNVGNFTQSVNLGNTNSYTLSAYAYTDGSAVTSSDASLFVNNNTVSTTYTSVGSGWYQLTATVTGTASSQAYGVQVATGRTVYVDDLSLWNYTSSESTTSSIFDATYGTAWGTLTWAATTPTNTTATVKVRTSNNSDMSGATAFASCSAITSGTDISSDSCVTDNHRYAQYQVTLTTSDGNNTPTFTSFSLAFAKYDTTAPASFDLDSPAGDSYTSSLRPTFRWKVSSDSGSGLSKYVLEVDNGDTGDFSIDNIPLTSDLTTDRYVIDYDNGYISVYTKSSSLWGSSQNDGKLKEGKRNWRVTAYDYSDNTTSTSRDLYVDFTKPTLTSGFSFSQGTADGYSLINTINPVITGTVTDNLNIDKIQVDYYKQNVFLGTIISQDLADSETLTRLQSDTASATSWNYSFTTSKDLDYGKYVADVKAYDKAGNVSTTNSYNIDILTQAEINVLLGGKPGPGAGKLSIPELEKKALIRRGMEATELQKLIAQITGFFDFLGIQIPNYLARIQPPRPPSITLNLPTFPLPKVSLPTFSIPAVPASKQIADTYINNPLAGFGRSANLTLKNTSKALVASVIGTISGIGESSMKLSQAYDAQQQKLIQQAGNIWQGQKVVDAVNLSITSVKKPVIVAGGFLNKLKIIYDTDVAILFDKEPTRISEVTVEEVGKDYAIISFKTNHPAWGKVNYGDNLSYGQEVLLPERSYDHKAKLTGLAPGGKYFFEVMAQNKNYTYDAYYVIQIPSPK